MPGDQIFQKTIAIIGGGFSGTAVAANLLRQATGSLRVLLIERKPPFGGVWRMVRNHRIID
jgi:cation diffusion facilitator CzcD-associated flavoprotein CzcO